MIRAGWASKLALLVTAIGATLAFSVPARADNGSAMRVSVKDSWQSVNAGGANCTWNVATDVTIVNLSDQTLTISNVARRVVWSGPSTGQQVLDDSGITVVNNRGLVTGVTIPVGQQVSYHNYQVQFVLPCTATDAEFQVIVDTQMGSGSAGAPFLVNGTAVPVMTAGAIAILAVGSTAFALRHRRGKPIPAVTTVSH